MKQISLIVATALALAACTFTNQQGETIVLNWQTLPQAASVVLAGMVNKCPDIAKGLDGIIAAEQAVAAGAVVQGATADLSALVTAGCALLVKPAAPATPPAG